MALASEAVATPAHGEAGDFSPTADLRATCDPLWRALAEFRRRLIVGGAWSVLEWRELLQTVRDHADAVGLKPEFAGVGSIMATAGEAVAADAQTFDSAMLAEPWRWVVLIAEGPGGWIQEHDLADAFRKHAGHAIRWAESWMLARERQLVGFAMEAPATGEAGSGKPTSDGFAFKDEHLTLLAELAGRDRLVKATRLDGLSGMPSIDKIYDLFAELQQAGFVHRPSGPRLGYGITADGRAELSRRNILPD